MHILYFTCMMHLHDALLFAWFQVDEAIPAEANRGETRGDSEVQRKSSLKEHQHESLPVMSKHLIRRRSTPNPSPRAKKVGRRNLAREERRNTCEKQICVSRRTVLKVMVKV